jgi:hypothetical protein
MQVYAIECQANNDWFIVQQVKNKTTAEQLLTMLAVEYPDHHLRITIKTILEV